MSPRSNGIFASLLPASVIKVRSGECPKHSRKPLEAFTKREFLAHSSLAESTPGSTNVLSETEGAYLLPARDQRNEFLAPTLRRKHSTDLPSTWDRLESQIQALRLWLPTWQGSIHGSMDTSNGVVLQARANTETLFWS